MIDTDTDSEPDLNPSPLLLAAINYFTLSVTF